MDTMTEIGLLLQRAHTCCRNASVARRVSREGLADDRIEGVQGLERQIVHLHEQAMALRDQATALARQAVRGRGLAAPAAIEAEMRLLLQVAAMGSGLADRPAAASRGAEREPG